MAVSSKVVAVVFVPVVVVVVTVVFVPVIVVAVVFVPGDGNAISSFPFDDPTEAQIPFLLLLCHLEMRLLVNYQQLASMGAAQLFKT